MKTYDELWDELHEKHPNGADFSSYYFNPDNIEAIQYYEDCADLYETQGFSDRFWTPWEHNHEHKNNRNYDVNNAQALCSVRRIFSDF